MKTNRIGSLTIAFASVFLFYYPIERYVLLAFEENGEALTGLILLTLGYGSLFASDFLSPILIGRFGIKRCLIVAAGIYGFLGFAVAADVGLIPLIIMGILMGPAAALLWNATDVYIIHVFKDGKEQVDESEGSASGVDDAFGILFSAFGLAAFLGLAITSTLLVTKIANIRQIIFALSLLVFPAIFFFSKIRDISVPKETVGGILKAWKSLTVLRMASVSVATFVMFGLAATAIPDKIGKIVGPEWNGYMQCAPFLILIPSLILHEWINKKVGKGKAILFSILGFIIGTVILFFADSKFPLIVGIAFTYPGIPILFVNMFTLLEYAPKHKVNAVNSVMTSADDISAFVTLAFSALMEWQGINLNYLFLFALSMFILTFIAIFPFPLQGENFGDDIRKRLENAFPE